MFRVSTNTALEDRRYRYRTGRTTRTSTLCTIKLESIRKMRMADWQRDIMSFGKMVTSFEYTQNRWIWTDFLTSIFQLLNYSYCTVDKIADSRGERGDDDVFSLRIARCCPEIFLAFSLGAIQGREAYRACSSWILRFHFNYNDILAYYREFTTTTSQIKRGCQQNCEQDEDDPRCHYKYMWNLFYCLFTPPRRTYTWDRPVLAAGTSFASQICVATDGPRCHWLEWCFPR
jgi:hypothetical protein